MGNHTNFIMRTLHLLHQLNGYHLEIDQISGFDCLPGEISTAERQAVQVAAESLRFMDEIPGGFFIYRADNHEEIIYANSGVLNICQCDTLTEFRELTKNSFQGLVYTEDFEAIEESIRRQIAANQYDLDYMVYRIQRKDGSLCWVEDYTHFIHDESFGDIFYVFWGDSSGKRKYQQILQNRILMDALEKASVAVRARKTFLSQISHEMRTPLNAILGFTALAKTSPHDSDEVSKYLEQVEIASHHLLDMITEALEVSALQSAEESIQEECDLHDTMRKIHDVLLPQAQEKSISLSMDCANIRHSCVYTYPEQLKQLVLSLADNALTYTNAGGKVDIALTEDEDSPDSHATFRLEVKDTGIGMSEAFLKKMFEPFAREKNSTISGIQGIGLGLTIAKNIADLLGGTITVGTKVNEGSVFTVSLPFSICSPSDAPGNQQVTRPNLRILLAEDNDLNREVEVKLLQREGFVVDAVSNGGEVLEKVGQALPCDYDLMILDLQMPVMDGWEVSAAIRKLPDQALARIPIIALSAHVGFQHRRQSLESGIDAHLSKPMEIDVLLKTIEQLTKKRIS